MRMEFEGYKNLTKDNWNKKDPIMGFFKSPQADGTTTSTSEDEWFDMIYKPSLSEAVPIEIHKLFEMARGMMLYGYYYYPLFTLSHQQLLRVGEAVVYHKCVLLGLTKSKSTFRDNIEMLTSQKILNQRDITRWEAIRFLRNSYSHQKEQSIITPAVAIQSMSTLVELANKLFEKR